MAGSQHNKKQQEQKKREHPRPMQTCPDCLGSKYRADGSRCYRCDENGRIPVGSK